MEFTLGGASLAGYLLALGRVAGFIVTAPPFNTRAVPAQARVGLAIGLALPLAALTTGKAPALDSSDLIKQVLLQLVTGAVLGFVVMLAVAVIQTIGDLIDVIGGFSLSLGLDPLMLNQSSVMGRLHNLLAITLLFAGDGHLIVLRGLSRSVELLPDAKLNLDVLAGVITRDVSTMFLAAVQITAPIMGALLIADLALGLLTRAAPALNAFSLAFPLKITLSLLLIGLVLYQIPDVLGRVVDDAGGQLVQLSGG